MYFKLFIFIFSMGTSWAQDDLPAQNLSQVQNSIKNDVDRGNVNGQTLIKIKQIVDGHPSNVLVPILSDQLMEQIVEILKKSNIDSEEYKLAVDLLNQFHGPNPESAHLDKNKSLKEVSEYIENNLSQQNHQNFQKLIQSTINSSFNTEHEIDKEQIQKIYSWQEKLNNPELKTQISSNIGQYIHPESIKTNYRAAQTPAEKNVIIAQIQYLNESQINELFMQETDPKYKEILANKLALLNNQNGLYFLLANSLPLPLEVDRHAVFLAYQQYKGPSNTFAHFVGKMALETNISRSKEPQREADLLSIAQDKIVPAEIRLLALNAYLNGFMEDPADPSLRSSLLNEISPQINLSEMGKKYGRYFKSFKSTLFFHHEVCPAQQYQFQAQPLPIPQVQEIKKMITHVTETTPPEEAFVRISETDYFKMLKKRDELWQAIAEFWDDMGFTELQPERNSINGKTVAIRGIRERLKEDRHLRLIYSLLDDLRIKMMKISNGKRLSDKVRAKTYQKYIDFFSDLQHTLDSTSTYRSLYEFLEDENITTGLSKEDQILSWNQMTKKPYANREKLEQSGKKLRDLLYKYLMEYRTLSR